MIPAQNSTTRCKMELIIGFVVGLLIFAGLKLMMKQAVREVLDENRAYGNRRIEHAVRSVLKEQDKS